MGAPDAGHDPPRYFFGRPADEAQAVATLQQRLADLELATRLAQHTPLPT